MTHHNKIGSSGNYFPIIFGVLIYATVRLLQDTGSGTYSWERPLWLMIIEICVMISLSYVNIYVVRRICNYNNTHSLKRGLQPVVLWKELAMVIIFNNLLMNLTITPFAAVTDDGLSTNDFVTINVIPLLYILIYYGVLRSGTYMTALVKHQLLIEQLSNDKLSNELKFLKAQYHPHFLFNALNTIYFQVDEDIPAAKNTIEQLSNLLRYQLYNQEHQVTLTQEFEYLSNYILLQKVRVSKKLSLKIDFNPELSWQQVYSLLFMPLVENAFKYVGGKYVIEITAVPVPGGMRFRVMNDLPSKVFKPDNHSGIGLENLKRRLELLYPGTHKLQIGKENNQYTATLEIIFEA